MKNLNKTQLDFILLTAIFIIILTGNLKAENYYHKYRHNLLSHRFKLPYYPGGILRNYKSLEFLKLKQKNIQSMLDEKRELMDFQKRWYKYYEYKKYLYLIDSQKKL